MSEEANVIDNNIYANTDMFFAVFNYTLLEIIGVVFTIIAFILIFISSIKLFRSSNAPGTKLIFYSVLSTLLVTVVSISYLLLADGEENYLVEAVVSMFIGIAFFAGSYGFLKLAKFVASENVNK